MKHIITGNLGIIKNKKLRNLLSKGLKYIEPTFIPKSGILRSIKNDLRKYIKKISVQYSINKQLFDNWYVKVVEEITKSIYSLKLQSKRKESIVKSEKEELEQLKSQFVFTSIDKASNNISIICKKFYLENIKNELSITPTYTEVNNLYDSENIINNHVKYYEKYNIEMEENCKILPFIHMLPKFHKNPIDFRYIAAAKRSSTKQISKILSSVLGLMLKSLKHHSKFKFKFKGTSSFWIADNKDDTLSYLNYINHTAEAKNIEGLLHGHECDTHYITRVAVGHECNMCVSHECPCNNPFMTQASL